MKSVFTSDAPKPIGPYSQAMLVGPFLFCSGQVPIDPKTHKVNAGSIVEQTHLVMKNIGAILHRADFKYKHIIKTSIFLSSMDIFAEVNEVYSSYLLEPFPARSCVAVKELPKGVDVEIEVLAYQQRGL